MLRTICKYCREEVVVNPHILGHNAITQTDLCNNKNYISLEVSCEYLCPCCGSRVVLEAVEPLTPVDSFRIAFKNRGLIL